MLPTIFIMKITFLKYYYALVASIFLLFFAVACGPAQSTESPQTSEPAPQAETMEPPNGDSNAASPQSPNTDLGDGYPAPSPAPAVTDGPYPPPTRSLPQQDASYPEPEATSRDGIPFAFERPIRPGDTVIRGAGPADVHISIVNVTFMGEELASTTVDEDGQFEVEVPALEAGIRIGLSADIEGTDLAQQIVAGEGAMNVPQVGYYFDTVVITADS